MDYTNDLNGNPLQLIHQTYNGNSWVNSSRTSFKYDSKGNIDSAVTEYWQNNLLVKYFYSEQNIKDSLLFHKWSDSCWTNDAKTTFYYKNKSGLDSTVSKIWQGIDWLNYWKRIITNDPNNNEIEQLDQFWNSLSWQDLIRRFFTYNDLNYITSAYCELFYNLNWVKGDGDIMVLGPDGFIAAFIANRITIYYSNFTNINVSNTSQEYNFYLSQNYPNPRNPATTINYSVPKTCFVSLKVYNILGKEIAALVNTEKSAGNYQVQFNGDGLASGVYIYRIKAGEYLKSRLMILEK